MARMSVLSFGHRATGTLTAPWLPKRIIDFDGNEYPLTPSLRWVDQYERLRNRIAINRSCKAMWGRRTRRCIDEQNRRLRNRIAINRLGFWLSHQEDRRASLSSGSDTPQASAA
jgi:hypothetical protein